MIKNTITVKERITIIESRRTMIITKNPDVLDSFTQINMFTFQRMTTMHNEDGSTQEYYDMDSYNEIFEGLTDQEKILLNTELRNEWEAINNGTTIKIHPMMAQQEEV